MWLREGAVMTEVATQGIFCFQHHQTGIGVGASSRRPTPHSKLTRRLREPRVPLLCLRVRSSSI